MITVEQIEALQGRLAILPIQKSYQDAEFQKVVADVRKQVKAKKIDLKKAVQTTETMHLRWLDFTNETRLELIAVADWGLQYSLNLLSCLELSRSMSNVNIDDLVSKSIAELDLLKLAIETPKDDGSNWQENTLKGWGAFFDVDPKTIGNWFRASKPCIKKPKRGWYLIDLNHPFIVSEGWKEK